MQPLVTHFGRSLTFAGFTALYTYFVMIGATYGLLVGPTRLLSLVAVAIVAVVWLVARLRGGWSWQRTPLDSTFLLWIGAIGLSLILNPLTWRRELIGVWFVLLYIGVWYLLNDLLARGVLRRDQLMKVVMFGSVVVVVLGFVQTRTWFTDDLPLILSRDLPFSLPRPGSTLGNPNTLASILVLLIPLTLAHVFRLKGLMRIVALAFAGVSALLMFLTYSRGGWIGLAVAFAVQVLLLMLDRGWLHPDHFWRWWAKQSQSIRAGVITTLLAGVLVVLAVVIIGIVSLSQGGRSVDLRTYIFSAAINLFAEKPIAGHGLFTFGRGLAAQASTPPYYPHSHAHNLILHVAAELGIVGLIALLATGLVVVRAARSNWQTAGRDERLLLGGAFAAVAGFVAHHLFDVTAMVPAIALTGLIALVAATGQPSRHEPIDAVPQKRKFVVVAALWVGLLISGFYSMVNYLYYEDALQYGIFTGDYTGAAERLQTIIDRDPDLATTYYQQGYFYGLAAEEGNENALNSAIEAYSHYVHLEPHYVNGWLNLSALYAQRGDTASALEGYRSAVGAAPEHWVFQYMLARAEEAAGNEETARALYDHVRQTVHDLTLFPDWPGTPLRDAIAAEAELTDFARAALLLADGDGDAARGLWDTTDTPPESFGDIVIDAWLAIEAEQDELFYDRLDALRPYEKSADGGGWIAYLEAQYAEAKGDSAAAQTALDAARDAVTFGPFDTEDPDLANINYIQFLRTAISRQYLPQVNYPIAGPLIMHLLAQEP